MTHGKLENAPGQHAVNIAAKSIHADFVEDHSLHSIIINKARNGYIIHTEYTPYKHRAPIIATSRSDIIAWIDTILDTESKLPNG